MRQELLLFFVALLKLPITQSDHLVFIHQLCYSVLQGKVLLFYNEVLGEENILKREKIIAFASLDFIAVFHHMVFKLF